MKELTGKGTSLDVYVNGMALGKIEPSGTLELNIDVAEAEVYVKTNWVESNRLKITSDTALKTYARGGILVATFISLFSPKNTYILVPESEK
ncbi:MAG: hypothetical protein IT244_09895 [Bacteroidia bacterium]|nr:hypothetical protein [Bacteroidia bacterium]